MTEIIGRGTWIDKVANKLILREQELGRNTSMLRVESGLGASGIPHIGSLGDAVRSYSVCLALREMGYDSELIAYSDDMDGLRKIPAGFPDSLNNHIARPVSMIPDPFECHDSYGSHMSSILMDGLDKVGIKYQHKRALDTYKNGLLKNQTDIILQNSQLIGSKIAELVGQEKYRHSLPYFPVCHECGRLYTAKATEYLADEKTIRYVCTDAEIDHKIIAGCNHNGYSDITKDLGKLAWKTEFAARWSAFDIRFEAYGKDIMDSVIVNDWVADEVLGFPRPYHVKYEMFLDKGGKKISKSLGNVLTAQRWLEFGTPESILLLLYKRIKGAREVGLADIPTLMNEYNELEDVYFGKPNIYNESKLTRLRGLYEYVNLLKTPAKPSAHIDYKLLVNLARTFGNNTTTITKKLIDDGLMQESDEHVDLLIRLAGNYSNEFTVDEKIEIMLDDSTKHAILQLVEILDNNNADLQNQIYNIAKSHDIKMKDFFKSLYQIILGQEQGPRIGQLIDDLGRDKVSKMLKLHI